jgi:lipoprotein-releasing system permease protein
MVLSLRIAVRFLLSGKGQTLLIVGGIAIAISVQVFVGLLIDGLQAGLVQQTVGNSPQITVRSAQEDVTVSRWEEMVTGIRSLSGVERVGVAASANAFVRKGNDSVPVLFRGLDPVALTDIYHINEGIYEGQSIQASGDCAIGRTLSEKLSIGVGDRLQIATPGGATVDYRVVGLFDLGVGAIDGSWVVASLRTGQSLFGFGDRVTSVEATVSDVFQADVIAARVASLIGSDDIEVTNWKDENGQLLNALESQSLSNNIIQAVIIVSVAIAIASLLSITVLQKRRQLGILKAMGIKDGSASLIFLFQGLLIGAMASALGIALGLALLYSFAIFATTGGESIIEFSISPVFVLRSLGISLLASALAGLVPAGRSLRLNPIDVIREG